MVLAHVNVRLAFDAKPHAKTNFSSILLSPGVTSDFRSHAVDTQRMPSVMADFGQTDFGQTDFGQTDFGQIFDRFWPIVVLTDFGQTDFGQFGCFIVLAKFSGVVVVVVCCCAQPLKTLNLAWESGRGPTCSGFGVVVVVVVMVVAGLDIPGPPSAGQPPPLDPLRQTAQNFALFLPFPRHRFGVSVSLWVSSR